MNQSYEESLFCLSMQLTQLGSGHSFYHLLWAMAPMSVQFSSPFNAIHYLSSVYTSQWLVWGFEGDLHH